MAIKPFYNSSIENLQNASIEMSEAINSGNQERIDNALSELASCITWFDLQNTRRKIRSMTVESLKKVLDQASDLSDYSLADLATFVGMLAKLNQSLRDL